MLCENCGKNEANVKYTENINGKVRELHLCEECSRKLGIGQIDFNIPIDFSNFLSGFMEPEFMPMLNGINKINCKTCGTTFDDILNTGMFGCSDCFETFQDRIDPIIKKIQGSNRHVGRVAKEIDNKIGNEHKEVKKSEENNVNENKLEKLQEELKEAIKEERYEDAAKIRDEIKKLEK